jgi:hypothetical protein
VGGAKVREEDWPAASLDRLALLIGLERQPVLIGRLGRGELFQVAPDIFVGDDQQPRGQIPEPKGVVAVAVGQDEGRDGQGRDLLDLFQFVFDPLDRHLDVDEDDVLVTQVKTGVGARPALDLIKMAGDVLCGRRGKLLLGRFDRGDESGQEHGSQREPQDANVLHAGPPRR